jgi:phage-related protein
MIQQFKAMIPVKDIVESLRQGWAAFKTGLEEFGQLTVIQTWASNVAATLSVIQHIIRDQLGAAIRDFPGWVEEMWARFGPLVNEAASYLVYFFRIASDIFKGIKNLLRGNAEDARKLFANAWYTAVAVAIEVLSDAATTIVTWGRNLIASYAKGIVEGIKMYLAAALSAVASFLGSWMSPGSPPKFLPDIGTWGEGAMQAYLDGFASADYGVLLDSTSQIKDELMKLVDTGDLAGDAFADTFFEMRGALTEVIAGWKETGVISADTLDILTEKLGKTGTAMSEMLQLQLQSMQIEKQLTDLREKEAEAVEAAQDAYEAGDIGVEEYEDLVKAAREKREEEEEGLQTQRSELQEQMDLLAMQQKFHEETLSIYEQQEQYTEAMKEEIEKAAGGAGKLKEDLEEAAAAALDIASAFGDMPGLPDQMGMQWDLEEPVLDFGDMLPNVEETKAKVQTFFEETIPTALSNAWQRGMEMAQEAVLKSPIANALRRTLVGDILPELAKIPAWFHENFPVLHTFVTEMATAIMDDGWAGAVEAASGWLDWLKNYILIWWAMDIEPMFAGILKWWEDNGPVLEAVFATVWIAISETVVAAIATIVDVAWPRLQEAFGTLGTALEEMGIGWDDVWKAVGNTVLAVASIIGAILVGLVAIIVGVVTSITKTINNFVMLWVNLKDTISEIALAISGIIAGMWAVIVGIFTGNFELIKEGARVFGESVTGFFVAMVEGIVQTWLDMSTLVFGILGGFVEGVVEFFTNLYNELVGNSIVPDMMTAIFDSITGTIDTILEWFPTKIQEFSDAGADMINGLKSGVLGAVQGLIDSVVGAIGAAIAAAKGLLEEKSESKVFKRIGEFAIKGYMSGVAGMIPALTKQTADAFAPATMGPMSAPGRGGGTANYDQSTTDNSSKVVHMTVTLDGGISIAQFKTMFTEMMNDRG